MQLTNSFSVNAPPDRTWSFILDVNKLAGCLPGVELAESHTPDEFKGKVKVKVGPISVSYNGVARLRDQDDANHTVTVEAEGREPGGSGMAQVKTYMTILATANGSTVNMVTDLAVHGRVAQFGRGIMQDVSRALVKQMADCIRAKLQAEEAGASTAEAGQQPATPQPGSSMDGLSLMGSVVKDRAKRIFGRD